MSRLNRITVSINAINNDTWEESFLPGITVRRLMEELGVNVNKHDIRVCGSLVTGSELDEPLSDGDSISYVTKNHDSGC